MSSKRLFSHVPLLRSSARPSTSGKQLRQACSPLLRQRRTFRTTVPFKQEERSFKGQLYESTSQRLQRERAEQARFAKERGESKGGRNAAITFGKLSSIHDVEHRLMACSRLLLILNMLLSWDPPTSRSGYNVYYPSRGGPTT